MGIRSEWNSERFDAVWKRVSGQEPSETEKSGENGDPIEALLKLSTEGAGLYAGTYRCCRKEDIRQKLGQLYREKCEELREARHPLSENRRESNRQSTLRRGELIRRLVRCALV